MVFCVCHFVFFSNTFRCYRLKNSSSILHSYLYSTIFNYLEWEDVLCLVVATHTRLKKWGYIDWVIPIMTDSGVGCGSYTSSERTVRITAQDLRSVRSTSRCKMS